MATFALPELDAAEPVINDVPTTLGLADQAVQAYLSSVVGSNFYRSQNAFDHARRKLRDLIEIRPGWNHDDSEPPSLGSLNRAESILRVLKERLLLPNEIGPSAESGTFLGFCGYSGRRAAIECLNDGETYAILYDDREFCHTIMIGGDHHNVDEVVISVANYLREHTLAAPESRR